MHAVAVTMAERLRPIGRWMLLLAEAFSTPGEYRRYRHALFRQMVSVGLASLPVVMLAAAFTGAVLTVQADYQTQSPLMPRSLIGTVVTASVILELAVLITAFILAGRVGARMAAELAAMRVGEQIDALQVMGINAAGYLIAPRVLAGTLMFPLLYIAAAATALLAALVVAQASDIISTAVFLKGARSYFETYDILYGLVKATVFGFLLTSISCYKGYRATGGAEGIGRSATQAAVLSCVYMLCADYVLAEILL